MDDVWGSRIEDLVWEVLQKLVFHICWDYVDFGVIFTWFSMALGPILMTCGGLRACLKLHDFRWVSGGVPDGRAPCRMVVFGMLSGPYSNSQTVGVVIQHARYIMKHAGMKGYEKTRMQITKMRKITAAK